MRFFTREWAFSDLSAKKREEVRLAYNHHLAFLLPTLPKTVARLAKLNLHDGIIRRIEVKQDTGRLVLGLRCGDLQTGYFDLDLTYLGVRFEMLDLPTLIERAHDCQTELLYDEIDIDEEEGYVHRILFWPEGEASIIFSALQIGLAVQPDRAV